MKYIVQITEPAEDDMREIFFYLAYQVKAGKNALQQIKRIQQAIAGLDEFPERYRRYEGERWNGLNLRIMPVDKFIVAYAVDNAARSVLIYRVLHGSRDIDAELAYNLQ